MLLKRLIAIGLATLLILGSGGLQAVAAVVRVVSPAGANTVNGRVEVSVGYESTAQAPVTKIVIELDGQPYGVRPVNPPQERGVISLVVDTNDLTSGFHGFGFHAYSRNKLVGKAFVKLQVAGATGGSRGPAGTPPKLDAGRVQAEGLRDGETLSGKRTVKLVPAADLGGGLFVAVRVDGSLRFLSNRAPYSFTLDSTQLADGKHDVDVQVRDASQQTLAARSYKITVANASTLSTAIAQPSTPRASYEPERVASRPAPEVALPSPEPASEAARATEANAAAPALHPSVPRSEAYERAVSAPVEAPQAEAPDIVALNTEPRPASDTAVLAKPEPSVPAAPEAEPSASSAEARQDQPVLMASLPKAAAVAPSAFDAQAPALPVQEPQSSPAMAAPRSVSTKFDTYGPRPVLETHESVPPATPAADPPRLAEDDAVLELKIAAEQNAADSSPATSRGAEPSARWMEASASAARMDALEPMTPPEVSIPLSVDVSAETRASAETAIPAGSEPAAAPLAEDAASSAAAVRTTSPQVLRVAMAPRPAEQTKLARPASPEVAATPMPAPQPVQKRAKTVVYSRPVVVQGSPLFGLREAVQRLGGQVSWDNQTKTATASLGGRKLVVDVRSGEARTEAKKILGARVSLRKDHVYLTADSIASALGLKVDWSAESKRVRMVRTVSR